MKRIDKAFIEFDDNSHIDPAGRVFYWNQEIYRAFYPQVSPFYRDLLASARMRDFVSQGKVIETVPQPHLEVEGYDLIVKHRRIEHPNYCFEWSANMLKDAAVLLIDLAIEMCQDNIILQDATPFNIFFQGGKPIFIDIGSFWPGANKYLWAAYQQYCNFFLFPLYIYSSGNSSIPRALLSDCYNGVAAGDVKRILGFLDKFRLPGYLRRVSVSETVYKFSHTLRYRSEMDSLYEKFSSKVDVSRLRAKFLRRLQRDISNIRLPDRSSDWSGYYDNTDKDALRLKKEEVCRVLAELRPQSILDIGCNQGEFSIMAAESGAAVVAVDSDDACVSRLFELAKEKCCSLVPLIMDILNPSPGIGWRGIEYKSAQERLKCEMVFAFALIHHLVFTGGQNFDRIIKSIKEFQKRWCIYEYVDQNDPMARLLPRRPSLEYSWYTLGNFLDALASNYRTAKILKRLSETRTLILAEI